MGFAKEFKKGVEKIDEERAKKKEGYAGGHPEEDSFLEGYRRGKKAKDPNNTDSAGETGMKVKKEYKGLSPKQRKAYKDGYRAGTK